MDAVKKLDRKIIENINNTVNHNVNNNFGFTLNFNDNSFKEVNPEEQVSKPVKHLDLNMINIPMKDFQQEFLDHYEDFSPSWRNECMKMRGFHPPGKENK